MYRRETNQLKFANIHFRKCFAKRVATDVD